MTFDDIDDIREHELYHLQIATSILVTVYISGTTIIPINKTSDLVNTSSQ